MASSPCRFVWYELMTSDPEAAGRFYTHVVGWRAQSGADVGMPADMPYTLLSAGDHMVAGLMAQPPELAESEMPPMWVGYVSVPDIDAATAGVRQAGGDVHQPPEAVPGVGRFAPVADPHGADFMLITPDADASGDAAPPPADAPGTVGWHELMAGNLDQDWTFYTSQFGWTRAEAIDMGPMGTYQLFAAGDAVIGGMMTLPPEVPNPFWLYYFNVAELDPALDRISESGGRVVHGPMEVPGGSWIVQALDPQGGMFALVAPRR